MLTVFCIICAFIIVVTRLILEIMEERDRARGCMINPDEYKISGLLKLIWKDFKAKVKEKSVKVKEKLKKGHKNREGKKK
jgi:Trm5-related predicted tRNA methylase